MLMNSEMFQKKGSEDLLHHENFDEDLLVDENFMQTSKGAESESDPSISPTLFNSKLDGSEEYIPTEEEHVEVKRGSAVAVQTKKPASRSTRKRAAPKKGQLSQQDKDQKRQRRLEKNREIARDCRKRKRERMEALKEEVVRLREWNKQLELKLNQDTTGKDREEKRRVEIEGLGELISGNKADSDIRKKLDNYQEIYSDFGKVRRKEMFFQHGSEWLLSVCECVFYMFMLTIRFPES